MKRLFLCIVFFPLLTGCGKHIKTYEGLWLPESQTSLLFTDPRFTLKIVYIDGKQFHVKSAEMLPGPHQVSIVLHQGNHSGTSYLRFDSEAGKEYMVRAWLSNYTNPPYKYKIWIEEITERKLVGGLIDPSKFRKEIKEAEKINSANIDESEE